MQFDDPSALAPVSFEQRYELRHQLWLDGPHGGWLGLDRLLGREVVVNIPYRPADNQRFLQVARLRARLRHANLIPLYDLGATTDGRPFFTQPSFEASDLRELQRDRDEKAVAALTLLRFVSYLLNVCKAVTFLHANNLFHLELHPGNILVSTPFEEVFVVRGHPSMPPASPVMEGTNAGLGAVVCGVPGYMAPEQVNPERLGIPDAATDVYGLGGILFAILYGKPPNGAGPASIIEVLNALMARKGPPTRGTFCTLAAQSLQLARKLEPVCLRALEFDRSKRHGDVSAFVKEVAQCAEAGSG
jgi:eukaryotic-like serine/threonine-protein kinase